MKAAIMVAADQALTDGDFPDPEPREGWELVDLVAAGIHPVVRSRATGHHYSCRSHVARVSRGALVLARMSLNRKTPNPGSRM